MKLDEVVCGCFHGNHIRIYPDIDNSSSKLGNQPLIVINLQSFEYGM